MGKAIIIATFLVAGCGTNLGFVRDSTTSQTFSYAMDVKQLHMKRTVSASIDTKTLICLIPTSGEPVYATVMERLHQEAKLKPNEVLVNLREDKQILTYLIYCKNRLTVSADVYQLGHTKPPETKPKQVSLKKPAFAKSKPEPKPSPCQEDYWDCMKECGTKGCGGDCVAEKKECDEEEKKGAVE